MSQAHQHGLHVAELTRDEAISLLAGDLQLAPLAESEQDRIRRVLGPKERDDTWASARRDAQREALQEPSSRSLTNLGLQA